MSYKPKFISRICSIKSAPIVFMGGKNFKLTNYCVYDTIDNVYFTESKSYLRVEMDFIALRLNTIIVEELTSYDEELSNYLNIKINSFKDDYMKYIGDQIILSNIRLTAYLQSL